MQLNFLAIILATVVQFIIGAIWYSVFFGKLWGKIHGFDKLPKDVQEKMMKSMGPFYVLQAFVTLITSVVLAIFITYLPLDWNFYALSGFFWIGFVVPTQVSGVIFGGTEGKWILSKIAVQAGCSLVCLQAATFVLILFR
ncbi:MAG: DUF1761 domain-containing protein [Candidatus Levybacteria bacterium]|nr:DUF1761 domain-containing protein [Candidatus Levybacteria bacterium]